jgi:hypothetical protein
MLNASFINVSMTTFVHFPENDLLTSVLVLNKVTVLADPLDMALFGESDVAKLCSTFK